jgi:hypothetical protein
MQSRRLRQEYFCFRVCARLAKRRSLSDPSPPEYFRSDVGRRVGFQNLERRGE